jgi:hypothetical protein
VQARVKDGTKEYRPPNSKRVQVEEGEHICELVENHRKDFSGYRAYERFEDGKRKITFCLKFLLPIGVDLSYLPKEYEYIVIRERYARKF